METVSSYLFADEPVLADLALPELPLAGTAGAADHQYRIELLKSIGAFDQGVPSFCWRSSSGAMTLNLVKTAWGNLLRFPHLAMFTITNDSRRIGIHPEPGVTTETLRHLLLDQVLPRLLAHHGRLIVHGSAVQIDDRALVFIGDTGVGKSTLAASFSADGHRLLCDDGIVLTPGKRCTMALPTYRSLRLWPDSVAGIYPEAAPRVAPMAHYSTKQRVLVDDGSPPAPEPLPLAAVYVLSSTADTKTTSISRLSARDACMAIIRNAFQLDVTDRNRTADLMSKAGDVAEQVPVFALSYPRGYEHLPAVRAAVLEHLAHWAACAEQPAEGR